MWSYCVIVNSDIRMRQKEREKNKGYNKSILWYAMMYIQKNIVFSRCRKAKSIFFTYSSRKQVHAFLIHKLC